MTELSGKTACIVGAGEFTDRGIHDPFGLIIAADGGLAALQKAGVQPDLVIGDFDSLGYIPEDTPERTSEFTPEHTPERIPERDPETKTGRTEEIPYADPRAGRSLPADISRPEVCRLPVEKDDTDMAAACRAAWDRGFRSIRIYGGTGDRPDHFLANLQLAAAYSRKGGEVSLVAPAYTVYAVTNGSRTLTAGPGITFSVFCHTDQAEGVTIEGDVKYTVSEALLCNTRALGVSNLMTGKEARITVRRGTLLIFLYRNILADGHRM